MRGPLPLDDADFAVVRGKVMAKIEEPRRAPFIWRFAFAALVLCVLSFVMARRPVAPPSSAAPRHLLPLMREKEVVVSVPLSRPAGEGGAKRRVRVAHHRKSRPPTAVARMEIQTSDPDVRIIWITN
jgi:hypothetical protein